MIRGYSPICTIPLEARCDSLYKGLTPFEFAIRDINLYRQYQPPIIVDRRRYLWLIGGQVITSFALQYEVFALLGHPSFFARQFNPQAGQLMFVRSNIQPDNLQVATSALLQSINGLQQVSFLPPVQFAINFDLNYGQDNAVYKALQESNLMS